MTTKMYNQIVEEYGQRLYVFLYNNLRNTEDCKNLVQDIFETLWIERKSIEMEKIKSFLFTLAYRKMIDFTRREKTMQQYLSEVKIVSQTSAIRSLEARDVLVKAFGQLNEKYRNCILLRDQEGYSYDEIAEITGLTQPTVRRMYVPNLALSWKSESRLFISLRQEADLRL